MVVAYITGKRTACIKKYIDKEIACPSCNQYQLEVKIYRPYWHLMFIPFAPEGDKTAEIRCKNCGAPYNMYVTEQAYAARARTPLYLYSALLIIGFGLLCVFGFLFMRDKKRDGYVAAPMVGDVYALEQREGNSRYYYLVKIKAISGDSLFMYHTNYTYSITDQTLDAKDFFVKDDIVLYTITEMKKLREKGTLVAVQRGYPASQHYDREQ